MCWEIVICCDSFSTRFVLFVLMLSDRQIKSHLISVNVSERRLILWPINEGVMEGDLSESELVMVHGRAYLTIKSVV